MVHAEAYWFMNAALCLCSLPLGGKMAGLPAPRLTRLAAGAALGGAFALAALYVPRVAAIALVSLPLGVWLCFGRHGAQACLRCTLTTLCASLLLGGVLEWLMSAGMGALPSAISGLALCSFLYLLMRLLPSALCEVRQVELGFGGRSVILPAMLDSGNLLRDPITGLGVLVAPARALKPLFPDISDLCDACSLPVGFRLLNVRTAAGGGLWPMFRPDVCRLYLNGRACDAELLVAVAGRDYGGAQALVPISALPAKAPV